MAALVQDKRRKIQFPCTFTGGRSWNYYLHAVEQRKVPRHETPIDIGIFALKHLTTVLSSHLQQY